MLFSRNPAKKAKLMETKTKKDPRPDKFYDIRAENTNHVREGGEERERKKKRTRLAIMYA